MQVDNCTSPEEVFLEHGNGAADEAAKAALQNHPEQPAAVQVRWSQDWEDAVTTAKIAAKVGH